MHTNTRAHTSEKPSCAIWRSCACDHRYRARYRAPSLHRGASAGRASRVVGERARVRPLVQRATSDRAAGDAKSGAPGVTSPVARVPLPSPAAPPVRRRPVDRRQRPGSAGLSYLALLMHTRPPTLQRSYASLLLSYPHPPSRPRPRDPRRHLHLENAPAPADRAAPERSTTPSARRGRPRGPHGKGS